MKTLFSLFFLYAISAYGACSDYSAGSCPAPACVRVTGGGPPRCENAPNTAPTITAPNNGNDYAVSIPENTTAITDINATDDQGNTLTYSLSGTDAAKFTINTSTGVVTFITAPDYEVPTDNGVNNIYNFTVTVSDGSLTDTQTFTITVTDVLEDNSITYNFEECTIGNPITTVQDTSGNNNNATGYNGVSCVATDRGKGAQFDGTNDYIQSNSKFNYQYQNGFTVCGRLKYEPTTNRSWVLHYGAGTTCDNNGMHWLINMRSSGDCGNQGADNAQFGPFCGTSQNQFNTSSYKNKFATYATTYDKNTRTLKTYINGKLVDTDLSATHPTSGSDFVYVAKRWDSCSQDSYFKGTFDELKIFPLTLAEAGLQTSCQFGDGAYVDETVTNTFDAWDSFRSITDRNISTKIVGKDFNLTIASLNDTNTALQDFNGTVCARLINSSGTSISNWNQIAFNNQQTKTTTFNLNRAIGGADYAKLDLHWKTNATASCPLNGETNNTIASDYFSVRPTSFSLNTPNAVAGTDFNITLTAPNYSSIASNDYNATVGSSFDVAYAEHNASCPIGTFNPVITSGWSFANGTKTLTTRYNEVGVVDINISDVFKSCATRYANVDCDDANIVGYYNVLTDLPIGTTQGQITIKPHHFDLNATLSNSGGGIFTYLSTDLNMSSKLDINATAKNGQNATTLNYDKGCYAKTTTITLTPSVPTNSLTKILYHENLSNTDGNVSKNGPISIPFSETIFTQGSAPLTLLVNFDRSSSTPINPFDFNITNAVLTDINGTTGTISPMGTARYVYGRARAYDIKTDQPSAPNPIELEVYSTTSSGYVTSMPQNILHWYRNLNHSTLNEGRVVGGGFTAGVSDNMQVDALTTPINGIHPVTVISTTDQTVHLDISPWLWYSPSMSYSYTTNCTTHPCFNYQYFGTAANTNSGVNSGTFQGSDFTLTPAKTIIKKGVKVFR